VPDSDTLAVVVAEDAYFQWRFQVWVEPLTDTEPVSIPSVVGVNEIFRLTVCPGVRVNGQDRPLTANPAPLTVSLNRLRLALPTLVIFTACA